MRRKIVSFFLVFLLLITSLDLHTFKVIADDEETSDNVDTSSENCDKACQLKKANDSIKEYKEKIKEASNNAELYSSLIAECGEKLVALEGEIDELTPQIEELEIRIAYLKISIEENEQLVNDLNNRVLTRMENAQGSMHFNQYLDFILGSNGFADMLRRVYGIEAINNKEESDRNELIDTIELLNQEKEELNNNKIELDEKKQALEVKVVELEGLREIYEKEKEEAEELVAYYQNLYDNAIQNRKQIYVTAADLASLSSISGFSSPVPGCALSAGFPYYPASFGGGVHLGVDYAAGMGANLYAPADGIILVADDGNCASYGYLGNSCGGFGGGVSYGGNQIYMICSVDGDVYALTFSHLYLNSVTVEAGDVVFQGDQIARVGSSGNSTGPHCHIEMFYLGTGDNEDLEDYIDKFNKGKYSLSFNCGWGTTALVNNCDNKGYRAPCRLNGAEYLPG